MNEDQHLLASAYLDGAVTSEERARAEADPEVMEAVERLRELRRALGAVAAPDPVRRDSAISAALDAFDAEPAPRAPVTPLQSRRMGGWLVSAAAAALVVVVVGGIIAVSNSDGDDDGGAADDAAAVTEVAGDEAPADATLAAAADTQDSDTAGGVESRGGAATTAVAAPEVTAAPGTMLARDEGTITATYSAAVLASTTDLTNFADEALRAGAPAAEVARRTCDEGRWLGSAMYVVDAVETPIEVFLAEDEVIAVDPSTCDVVARAPAP